MNRAVHLCVAVITLCFACKPAAPGGHGHEHSDSHAHAEEAPPVAITRWTDAYELFVEFPPLVAGKPMRFHAHVTRLRDFQAVIQGTFRVRLVGTSAEATASGVARPGIFTPEGTAPAAGNHTLEMTYESEGIREVFDCGPINVTATAPQAKEEAPTTAITFLKETQWRIPFATEWSSERDLSAEVELPATIEPTGGAFSTVTAPVTGRVLLNAQLSSGAGTRVSKGMMLGTLVPSVTGDDLAKLQASVDELHVTQEQLTREVTRIAGLIEKGLATQQSAVEATNRAEANQVRLKAAEQRLSRVLSQGEQDGVPLRSSMDGVIAEMPVRHGQVVNAGERVFQLMDPKRVLVRARFIAKAQKDVSSPAALVLPGGERVDLAPYSPRLLSAAPIVDAETRVATWTIELPGAGASGTKPLPLNVSSVLVMRSSVAVKGVAVPRTAVIELNTQPFVFVQLEGEAFEKRPVVLGVRDGEWVQVVNGIKPHERIVTRGGFDIHLGSLMGTIESHRH